MAAVAKRQIGVPYSATSALWIVCITQPKWFKAVQLRVTSSGGNLYALAVKGGYQAATWPLDDCGTWPLDNYYGVVGNSTDHGYGVASLSYIITSSVTNMNGMFRVRPSPCPAPKLQPSPLLHAACTAVARHLPPPGLHRPALHVPSLRLSAGGVGVQPAAELRHLQRHEHGLDVLRRVGVQPAAELRHLQRHGHGRHVRGALFPVPCPPPAVEPSPARCSHCGRPPLPASRHVYLAPCAPHRVPRTVCPSHRVPLLSTLGRMQPICPTPTSCSSVARGRAPRPSPPLAMARAGVRGPALEIRSARVLLERL